MYLYDSDAIKSLCRNNATRNTATNCKLFLKKKEKKGERCLQRQVIHFQTAHCANDGDNHEGIADVVSFPFGEESTSGLSCLMSGLFSYICFFLKSCL